MPKQYLTKLNVRETHLIKHPFVLLSSYVPPKSKYTRPYTTMQSSKTTPSHGTPSTPCNHNQDVQKRHLRLHLSPLRAATPSLHTPAPHSMLSRKVSQLPPRRPRGEKEMRHLCGKSLCLCMNMWVCDGKWRIIIKRDSLPEYRV